VQWQKGWTRKDSQTGKQRTDLTYHQLKRQLSSPQFQSLRKNKRKKKASTCGNSSYPNQILVILAARTLRIPTET
jgi:hypothetical protein